MEPTAILPWVSVVLQERYHDRRRAYVASRPELPDWPKRRSRKRHRQIPGLYEVAAEDVG